MRVVLRDLDSLRPYKGNPRINDQAVEAVARSIREFGFRQPIVIDEKGVIIVGHTRWKAAKKLGLKKVPVHVASDLTAKQKRAYRIADNQTADLAEWNYELLAHELGELEAVEFDLEALGFPADQIGALLDPGIREGLTDPDAIPGPPDKATTRRGDLYVLGEHRLLCGDAAEAADVDRLLGGKRIHMVNTDPPYNVCLEPRSMNAVATARVRGKMMHHQAYELGRRRGKVKPTTRKMRPRDRTLRSDFKTEEEWDALLRAWFGNIARVLRPGRAFYIWGGYSNCANYPIPLRDSGLHWSQAIIWVKQHPVLTRKDFLGNHEWCFYGWRKGAGHWFAFGLHNVPDVWEIGPGADKKDDPVDVGPGLVLEGPGGGELYITPKVPKGRHGKVVLAQGARATLRAGSPSDVWRVKKINPQSMIHLTEKPVELAIRAIQCSSRAGENILDVFGGSGSTLIGCEQTERRCYMMELDPLYCDVIVQRWEEFTGLEARREARAPKAAAKKRGRKATSTPRRR